jgi:hypothetical protein
MTASKEALVEDDRYGIFITELNGKFHVEHRYRPEPNVDEPSTFDENELVRHAVGDANTREEAEQLKQEYLEKLRIARENEDDEDGELDIYSILR